MTISVDCTVPMVHLEFGNFAVREGIAFENEASTVEFGWAVGELLFGWFGSSTSISQVTSRPEKSAYTSIMFFFPT